MEAVTPSRPRATYRDLLALPEHVTAELIDGELFVMPRPRVRHAAALSTMTADVSAAFGRRRPRAGPGGWVILAEPELHLGQSDPTELALVPDMAGWRRERMPEPPETAAIELAPDWICEVLSPSTEGHDRIRKMDWYGRSRVRWAWLVNPEQRSIEVYEHDGKNWVFHLGAVGNAPVKLQPFEAVEFDVSEWWAVEGAAAAP